MGLSSGTRIGPYTVTAELGAGGMGEVYRARDGKLDRDVALKVLPQDVAGDADRLARLQREARTLAALNHPNIAHVYGLENADGLLALAMELVEGPTLAERIKAGPIPLDEALPIARQIADALEAAHEQGVVHRDLKPANIKVRPDGTVKVLDFGLARVAESGSPTSSSMLPTLTSPAMTGVGVILGTAAYMSPEQAKGKVVDRRADIWAFGVVLAEMLTGKRMFDGETVSETLASVMKDAPVIPDAPPAISRLLTRCLERDPRRRLRDIGEARIVLEDPSAAATGTAVSSAAGPRTRSPLMWVSATAAAAIVGVAIGWFVRTPPSVDTPLRKFTLPVDDLIHGTSRTPQISPDGTKVVYSTPRGLWVRDLAALESRAIVTEGAPSFYTWSPDSTQVAYISADNRIMRVPAAGGQPVVVTAIGQTLGSGIGTAWTSAGRIVLTTGIAGTGLQHVAADGGDLTTFHPPESGTEQDFHDVSALPDDRGLVYALDRGFGVVDSLFVFAGGSAKSILHLEGETIRAPLYAATGHILFERTSNNPGIWAMPFSLDTLTATGDPFLVVTAGTFPSVSRDGTLMFVPPVAVGDRELVWVDRSGVVVQTIGRPLPGLAMPSLSPDRRLVAVAAADKQRTDIWVFDTATGTQRKLTFSDGDESFPSWSPSGDRVLFTRTLPPRQDRTIYTQPADGSGQSQVAVKTRLATSSTVSPDGRYIAYGESGQDAVKMGPGISYAPLDGSAEPRVFADDPGPQGDPRFSPDGRYLAYQSAESGRFEIYVKAFPSGEGKWQVSINGGGNPRWSQRGDRLFFLVGFPAKLMEVDVSTAGAFTVGTPRLVADFSKVGGPVAGWDVNAEGTRFLLTRQEPDARPQLAPMTIIQNWFAEFRNRR